MEVIIQPTPEAATRIATQTVAAALRRRPNAVLGLATGNTPLLLYRELAALSLDWRQVTTFNLDEYVGLPPEHPASYHHFMREHLFRHVNIDPANTYLPDGMSGDIEACCAEYEAKIRSAGGIDLQILGIGTDGHIGFNEPTSSLASRTRLKTLTPRTRQDNAALSGGADNVPQHVITMGIGTILDARHCLLLAFGKGKACAVAAAVEGAITAMNPASALQMHPKATLCLDEDAASELRLTSYYRQVYEHKPPAKDA